VPLLTDATPFGKLMRNYTWSSAETHALTIPGLVPGHTYRLQLISVAGKNAGVVVEASSPATWTDSYNGTPSVLKVIWVQAAGDTSLNVVLTRNHSFAGAHDNELEANGYALHDITPAPPAAPTDLTATPGSNSVGLTWSAASGATSYTVKRATVSGGPYTTLGSPAVTSYTDATAVNGTTYYYVVSATSGGGGSANSTQVSAAPAALTTTTSVASSLGATGVYGAAVTFTATVTAGATGTVRFRDGAAEMGSATLAAGQATCTTSTLAVALHSITASYESDATYAASVSNVFSYEVGRKAVTITGVTSSNKVYDTTVSAALTGGTVSGVVAGETVTVVPGSGSFADANVGTNKLVTASGYDLGGTNQGNYVLSAQPGVPTATITAKALTVSGITTAPKVYDGSTTALLGGAAVLQKAEPAGSGTADDGKPYTGDAITVTGMPVGTLAARGVGSQAVTITGNTRGGAQAGNYTLTQQTGLTQIVTPKALQANGLTVAASKPYDGTTTAAVSGTATGLWAAEAVGTGSAFDGKPYDVDTVGLAGAATGTGTYNSKDVATATAVTYDGVSLTGSQAGNYVLQVAATIAPKALALGGGRCYDGTTAIGYENLTIENPVAGDDVSLVAGGTTLANKHSGSQACVLNNTAAPARVGAGGTGSTGASAATSFNVTVAAPANGNTLVAVISTRSTSAGAVTGISQSGGATWARAVQTTGTAGTSTEIWYASNTHGAGTTVTIHLAASLCASAVITEYSGVLAANPVEQTANNTGSGTAATTGTTAATTEANELWIGGIGLDSSTPTLGPPGNSFTSIASAQSTSATAASNAKVYALEKLPGTPGTAASGGTLTGVPGAIALRGSGATYQWSSGATLTLTKPTGVIAGDVMLVSIAQHCTVGTPSAAALSNWTLVKSGTLGGSALDYGTILYKVAGSSEPTSYTFALTGTIGGGVGGIVAYSGVDNSTPLDAVGTSFSSSSGRATSLPSVTAITTVSPNALAILFGLSANASSNSSENWSNWLSGLGTAMFSGVGSGTAANATSVAANSKTIAIAGTTGIGGATLSRSEYNAGIWLALRPALQWSGAVATFKPQPASPSGSLELGGTAAANYTLAGATGAATITRLPLTLTAVMATKIYDGTTTAEGTPEMTPALVGTDSVSDLTQAFQDPNAGAGTKLIIPNIMINDGNGGTNYAVTPVSFNSGTITPAPATVTLGNLTPTYDGLPKGVSSPTDPAGLKVDLTYNGEVTAPTNAGTYVVVATIDELNYQGTASGNLVISGGAVTEWQTAHFLAKEIEDGLALDEADPDGDRLGNRAEYAFGTDPRSPNTQLLNLTRAADNTFTLRFQATPASGAGYAGRTRKYAVESTTDLANPNAWQGLPGFTNIDGSVQPADQTITLPIAGPSKFYRLNVRVE
jgi:hypothetical protein